MTLQTHEELEILHRIRRLEDICRRIEALCLLIAADTLPQHTYVAPAGIVFQPQMQ